MTKIVIISACVIVFVIIIMLILTSNKKSEGKSNGTSNNEFNEQDINMMQNVNEGGFVIKNKPSSKIIIPDFKQGSPIGYTDKNASRDTVGDKVAQDISNINKNNLR